MFCGVVGFLCGTPRDPECELLVRETEWNETGEPTGRLCGEREMRRLSPNVEGSGCGAVLRGGGISKPRENTKLIYFYGILSASLSTLSASYPPLGFWYRSHNPPNWDVCLPWHFIQGQPRKNSSFTPHASVPLLGQPIKKHSCVPPAEG